MIKGVTKNVIELNNLNSEYFERAIVIIRSDCPIDGDKLRTEARLAIGDPPAFVRKIKSGARIKMAICALSGALAAILFCGAVYLLKTGF